jgi:hypothetical protein
MSQPDTLVSKIYKARYFPQTSLFEAKIGANPSYAWRSIWNCRDVIMHSCVGGKSTMEVRSML